MSGQNKTLESQFGSLPIPLAHRSWNVWLAIAVCLSFAIGSWSFVVAGTVAYWLPARGGTAVMIAGALVSQFLLTLAQIRVAARYGIETVTTTKPQLGVRGSIIALAIEYIVMVGWSSVLIIFLGRAVAQILISTGVASSSSHSLIAVTASVAGTVIIWGLLQRGSQALKYAGPVATVIVLVVGVWMTFVLFGNYSLEDIFSREPIAPHDDKLTNYMLGFELMAISTISWWAAMGGVFRMVNSPRKAVLPSMLGLGAGWAIFGLISLYSALVLREPDPTIWMIELGGPVAGVATLLMVAVANLGSSLTMCYLGALGIGQVPVFAQRLSWGAQTSVLIVPVLLIVIFIPGVFYDSISIYIGFLGALLAPLVGVQIADWLFVHKTLRVSSLFRHDASSEYWYIGGVNPAGITGMIIGCIVYVALINPITFEPGLSIFRFTGAMIPSVVAGGVSYLIATRLFGLGPRDQQPS